MRLRSSTIALIAVVLAACTAADDAAPEPATPATTTAAATEVTPLEPTSSPQPGGSPQPEGSPQPGEAASAVPLYRPSAPPTGDLVEDAATAARGHLAKRLGVGEDAVAVATARMTEVPSGAPCGTGAQGGAAPDGLTLGAEVLLDAEGSTYRYVAAGGRLHPCGATPAR